MDKDSVQTLYKRLEQFRDDREWAQFHEPKNLIAAISGEVGELNRLTQWMSNDDIYHIVDDLTPELADIFIYLINIANIFGIDLIESANLKIDNNEDRYPVEKCKGVSTKAEEL